jgi:hypothetical protein
VVCHKQEQLYRQDAASRKRLHNIRRRTQQISEVQIGMSQPSITRNGRAEFELEVNVDEKSA